MMRKLWIGYFAAGFILLSNLVYLCQGARRYYRRPGLVDSWIRENYVNRPNVRSTYRRKLNTGSLSDLFFPATRSTVNGQPISPQNVNHRGNNAGRQFRHISYEPMMVNYTAQDIVERFPWIVNPHDVHGILRHYLQRPNIPPNSRSPNSIPGAPNQRTDNKDERIRFNNPSYLREWLDGLNQDNYGFRLAQGVLGANGKYKVRLNQNWRNLPVYGSSMVMEQENDTNFILESADGQFLSGIENDIASEVPALTSQQAIDRAISHNNDHGQRIQHPTTQLIVDTVGEKAILCYLINYIVPGKVVPNQPLTQPTTMFSTASTTTPFPVVRRSFSRRFMPRRRNRRGRRFRNRRQQNRRPRRWKRSVVGAANGAVTEPEMVTQFNEVPMATEIPPFGRSEHGSKRPWVLMNANTGEVMKAWDGLAAAIRPTRINILTGNPVIKQRVYQEVMYRDNVNDACYYQKPLGGRKFLRVNDMTDSPTANVYKFRCADGRDANYDQTNEAQSTRNNAFKWGSEAVNFLRRVSRTRWNFDLNIEVHHYKTTSQWNGWTIQLGDGDENNYYPMSSPDFVVHEVAHAFTEHVSNLEYNGQTSAIEEAYADMAAAAFMDHFFKLPNPRVYQIGILGLKRGTAVRDMCNPRNPDLLYHWPSRPIITSATQYQDSTPHHNASALYSKAFCELSKTRGWDIQQAFRVFTNANVIYWKPRENFNSGACGVKKAAHDFKNTAQSVRDVDRAFATVDIVCDSTGWINLIAAPNSS